MNDDDDVRQHEKESKPAVEDIKLLRNHLKSRVASKREVKNLRNDVEEIAFVLKRLERSFMGHQETLLAKGTVMDRP